VIPERGVQGDGGIYLPGGLLDVPAGGTLVDGDYEMVRAVWGTETLHTQRTIRLSNGGSYSEWVIDQDSPQDAGVTHYRINATLAASGTTLQVTATNCTGTVANSFGYTAAGDELDLFNFSAAAVFVYKRICTRR
jgi:hypothetical protein